MQLNGEVARYLLLAVTSPIWWPFLRELYKEMDNALREDGGLLGRTRAPKAGPSAYVSPLVSTPFRDPAAERAAPRSVGAAQGKQQASAAPPVAERRRGFRDR